MKIKALLALLLLCCIVFPVLAQTTPAAPPQSQKPSDEKDDVVRITTNLVQVDAVVTKDGKPVSNLTSDDFEIYETGKSRSSQASPLFRMFPALLLLSPSRPREKRLEKSFRMLR